MSIFLCALLLSTPLQADAADAVEAPLDAAEAEAGADEALEGAEEGAEGAASAPAEAVELEAATLNTQRDVEPDNPPFIEDVAVAASNPDIQPTVTAIITDDKGIISSTVYVRRATDSAFNAVALKPGEGSLFIAQLPDGIQTASFEYYVEVKDSGQNLVRAGSADEPFLVEAATEGTLERISRQERKIKGPAIHPAWVMISLGTGVLASAGAGAFIYDYFQIQGQIEDLNKRLEQGGDDVSTIPAAIAERERTASGDIIFGAVLGTIGVAALATGITLLFLNVEE